MQVFAYKMCNFLKKVFQCPPEMDDFSLKGRFTMYHVRFKHVRFKDVRCTIYVRFG